MIPPHVLLQVPGCTDGRAPQGVTPLPGGEGRNEVLRIDTPEGRFVWRRRLPPVDRPGAAARTELAAHRLAAAAGLAPPVIGAAADASWILMEYIDAPAWTTEQVCSASGIAHLARRLAELHAIRGPRNVARADAVQMAQGYVERLRRRDPRAAAALEPVIEQVREAGIALQEADAGDTLVHGDLAGGNMVGPAPHLVDWEYAQASDPSWDYACLLNYYPRLERHLDLLLGPADADGPEARERLQLQRRRFELLNALWERAYPSIA